MFMSEYSLNKSEASTAYGVWRGQQYTELHANKITAINTSLLFAFAFHCLSNVAIRICIRYIFVIHFGILDSEFLYCNYNYFQIYR